MQFPHQTLPTESLFTCQYARPPAALWNNVWEPTWHNSGSIDSSLSTNFPLTGVLHSLNSDQSEKNCCLTCRVLSLTPASSACLCPRLYPKSWQYVLPTAVLYITFCDIRFIALFTSHTELWSSSVSTVPQYLAFLSNYHHTEECLCRILHLLILSATYFTRYDTAICSTRLDGSVTPDCRPSYGFREIVCPNGHPTHMNRSPTCNAHVNIYVYVRTPP